MDHWWTRHLINRRTMAGLYDEEPSLDGFELRELRLEQRGPSCFIRGIIRDFPDSPRPSWDDGADRLQIRFNLSTVEDFRAEGKAQAHTIDLDIREADDGFGVVISGHHDCFDFEVAGIGLQIIGMKPYRE